MAGMDDDVAAIGRIEAVPTILAIVCRTTGMRFATVARVTEERWLACGVRDEMEFGVGPGDELKIETTICQQVWISGQPVVIEHAAQDPVYSSHPGPAIHGFESQISVPIRRPDGTLFGTLCALDRGPTKVNTPETIETFELFGDLIGFHLDAQERLATAEAALLDERETAELRDQFVAVLGHDLRNPLAAIDAGAALLRAEPQGESGLAIIALIQKTVRRMASLIDNVLDFAQVRLGGGLAVDGKMAVPLEPVIEQVVAELRTAWPDRRIDVEMALAGPIRADRTHVGQLLSNLLGNALSYGAKDKPVTVRASTGGGRFELSVANQGEPIPPAAIDRLFMPFFRATKRTNQQGLGLGLYIASEIARAHGGSLDFASTAAETRFTFGMPTA